MEAWYGGVGRGNPRDGQVEGRMGAQAGQSAETSVGRAAWARAERDNPRNDQVRASTGADGATGGTGKWTGGMGAA